MKAVPVEIQRDPPHSLDPYIDSLRADREQRYAGRPLARRTRAIQTIVHNEPVFLPIWLDYYSRYFGPADIYVLDNETTDGSTNGDGFVRIPVAHESVDHAWMADVLAEHQAELLDSYGLVLTVDVDEIVAPLPEWGDLGAYLDRMDEEWIDTIGYEIIHLRDREAPFDPARPVMDQRGYWFANDGYNKPVLATEPMRWVPGLHNRVDGRWNVDPDLRLIHLHRMDYEACRLRHFIRTRRAWNHQDVQAGWAKHNLIVDDAEFEEWFYGSSSFGPAIPLVVEAIPPSWRGRF